MTLLDELFDRYVGIALAKQCAFADSVPDPYWKWEYNEDGEKGTVKIPSLGEFDVQFLGSESYVSNTWLAAWANPSVANSFAKASQWMHDNVEKLGEPKLGKDHLPLNLINGDYVGVIATTLLNASTYVALPVGEGAGLSFQCIFDIPMINFAPTPLGRINTVIGMIEQSTQVSSISSATHFYLEDEGFTCEESELPDGFRKTFTDPAKRELVFDFKEIRDGDETYFQVTRNITLTDPDRPANPDHFDVTSQWDALVRAPLIRPASMAEDPEMAQ